MAGASKKKYSSCCNPMENINAFLYKIANEWHSLGIAVAYVPYVKIHNSPSKMEFNGRYTLLM